MKAMALSDSSISSSPKLNPRNPPRPFPFLSRSLSSSSLGGVSLLGKPKFSRFNSTSLVKAVLLEEPEQKMSLPKGDTWSIHKFGGTCVGTSERISNVADVIVGDGSERKLVVVSAMSKVTDMMYDLINRAQSRDDSYITAADAVFEKHNSTAADLLDGDDLASFLSRLHHDIISLKAMLRAIYIAGHATESFTDFVVGHGELWSVQILAYVVRKRGLDCRWMDTREVLIVNPTGPNQVDPDFPESEKRLEDWYSHNPSKTIIATGFIASTPENIPTTLKRDGSDFSAAIMGALVRAGQVTIWTDVDGVYSADPRKVSEAVILKTLSYQEAWEMSYFGANVLHPRTIIPVMRYDIPIVIRNIFNLAAPGTKICRPSVCDNQDERKLNSLVKGFATIDNVALINVEGTGMAGVPGTSSTIFSTVKDVGANVIMISQASSEHSVCFAVPEKEVKAVASALRLKFSEALGAGRISQIAVIPNCSILATVGQRMASTPGVCATLFNALAKANINIRAIAQGCSEYNITVVVKREDCIRALRAAHSRFFLSETTIAMGIVGPGLIGGTLLNQLQDQIAVLKEDFNIDLRVMGIAGSRTMLLSEAGIDLTKWRELYHATFLQRLAARIGRPIRIDNRTESCQRGKFARICVEIDLTKPLLATFRYGRRILRLQYEGLHLICFKCGRYGHVTQGCQQTEETESGTTNEAMQSEIKGSSEQVVNVTRPELESRFGNWMVVQKPVRPRRNFNTFHNGTNGRLHTEGTPIGNQKDNPVDVQRGGNSFSILQDSATEDRQETTQADKEKEADKQTAPEITTDAPSNLGTKHVKPPLGGKGMYGLARKAKNTQPPKTLLTKEKQKPVKGGVGQLNPSTLSANQQGVKGHVSRGMMNNNLSIEGTDHMRKGPRGDERNRKAKQTELQQNKDQNQTTNGTIEPLSAQNESFWDEGADPRLHTSSTSPSKKPPDPMEMEGPGESSIKWRENLAADGTMMECHDMMMGHEKNFSSHQVNVEENSNRESS